MDSCASDDNRSGVRTRVPQEDSARTQSWQVVPAPSLVETGCAAVEADEASALDLAGSLDGEGRSYGLALSGR
jgi:hypothetical protein